MRQPRGRSIDSPDDSDENRLIVTFSQHHNSQGTEAEEALHEMSAVSSQYQMGQQNLHHMHQQSWRQYVDGDITPTNEMCGRTGRDISTLAGDIDRDSLLNRNRGMTVPQRNKPIAMVKGNVLHTIPQQQQQQDLIKPSDDRYTNRFLLFDLNSSSNVNVCNFFQMTVIVHVRKSMKSVRLRPNHLDGTAPIVRFEQMVRWIKFVKIMKH